MLRNFHLGYYIAQDHNDQPSMRQRQATPSQPWLTPTEEVGPTHFKLQVKIYDKRFRPTMTEYFTSYFIKPMFIKKCEHNNIL